jgi:hypothetical protein
MDQEMNEGLKINVTIDEIEGSRIAAYCLGTSQNCSTEQSYNSRSGNKRFLKKV